MDLRVTIRHVASCLALAASLPVAYATEYKVSEGPPPDSVKDIDQTLDRPFGRFIRDPRVIFEPIEDWRKTKGPFLRDGQIKYNFRMYYFDAEKPETEPETWAWGGELAYNSGRWRDVLSVGASWYGSFKLSGNRDSDNSLLLDSDDDNISVLGQAYVKLDWKGISGKFYRQTLDMPYINAVDNRMVPNTFEAYGIGRQGTNLDFIVGYVDKIKLRNGDSFISMSQAAGVEGTDRGVTVAGVNWKPAGTNIKIGFLNQLTKDLFNTAYAEAHWTNQFTKHFGLKTSLQYTDQRASGDKLLGDFDTYTWGVRFASSYRNAVATVGYTQTDEGGKILSPYGGSPSYLSMMILDFDRANEKAWRAGLSYKFDYFGMPDLSVIASMVKGRDARDPLTGQDRPDQSEYNYTLDYKPSSGPLEGFWLRTRYANVRQDGQGKLTDELRIILNYSLPIL